MSLPLKHILKELETSPSSVIPILSTLHNNKAILQTISKQDRKHLVSRTLNLTRSPLPYNKWCGVNILFVLSSDYNVLTEEGVHILAQLIKIVEQQSRSGSLLESAVECLNKVCSQIRGKPTLTREILTPKLPTIISLFMEKLELDPSLFIHSLQSFMKKHPTTFRPFGNKLRARILEFLSNENFSNYPQKLKELVYSTLASLPVIEKTEPEAKWQADVQNLIHEMVQVVLIYREFLNFNDDSELLLIIQKIPQSVGENTAYFKALNVDVNDTRLLYLISERFSILCGILSAFVNTDTLFAVRVPIGSVLAICDIVISINSRFISFRNDTHDPELKSTIKSTLTLNQISITKILSKIPARYVGSVLPHLSNILSLLEVLIPFSNKRIDASELFNMEQFMADLLECVTNWLNLTSSLSDTTQVLRFIEVALILAEPQDVSEVSSNSTNGAQNASNGSGKKNKSNKKKSHSSVPLSDLLSHQHLFTSSVSQHTVQIIRQFINAILKKVIIPPTQYYKIMRYVFIEATRAKKYSLESQIPVDLKCLLVDAVLYPGNEGVSLLPLVTNLLGNDPIISVFNNPRFPPLAKYTKAQSEYNIEEDDEEEDEDEERQVLVSDSINSEPISIKDEKVHSIDVSTDDSPKRQKIVKSEIVQEVSTVTESVPNSMIFKSNEETKTFEKEAPAVVTQEVTTTFTKPESITPVISHDTSVQPIAAVEEDDNSDFEMPSIDVDDDEDED